MDIIANIPSFSDIMSKSYAYNSTAFNTDDKWILLKRLYEVNYLYCDNKTEVNIPKKIHQIWLGGELPDEYKRFADSWKKFNPDWEYRLWAEKDIDEIDIPRKYLYNTITNDGQRSDFLRYHILNQFGGLYVDTDFECLKSFDSLTFLRFFTGVGYPTYPELYVALIACTPHHPIMEHIVASLTEIQQGEWNNVFNSTGVYFFTKMFFEYVSTRTSDGVVALPTNFFYPFPNNMVGKEYPCKYVHPHSYAIHYWACSWQYNNK